MFYGGSRCGYGFVAMLAAGDVCREEGLPKVGFVARCQLFASAVFGLALGIGLWHLRLRRLMSLKYSRALRNGPSDCRYGVT